LTPGETTSLTALLRDAADAVVAGLPVEALSDFAKKAGWDAALKGKGPTKAQADGLVTGASGVATAVGFGPLVTDADGEGWNMAEDVKTLGLKDGDKQTLLTLLGEYHARIANPNLGSPCTTVAEMDATIELYKAFAKVTPFQYNKLKGHIAFM